VTARGDRREPIFLDDGDREALLRVVGQASDRFDAQMLSYCLMGNHYHFVLHAAGQFVAVDAACEWCLYANV
jgi:putative transposase